MRFLNKTKSGLIISQISLIKKGYVRKIYFKYKYKSYNPNMIIYFDRQNFLNFLLDGSKIASSYKNKYKILRNLSVMCKNVAFALNAYKLHTMQC